jgi:nitrogen fixation NifU-like protein
MSSSLDDMYREVILDHFRAPRGSKPLKTIDVTTGGHNPSCGDEISMDIEVKDGILKDVHVDCKGCAISVASGSMLAEAVKGKTFAEVLRLSAAVKKMLKGESVEIPEEFEDIKALQGVRQFPVRVKCALLAWVTLLEGIKNYENGKHGQQGSISTEDGE